MPKSIEIANYTYHLFASREKDDAAIYLYDGASTVIGEILFVEDDVPLPEATKERDKYTLYFRRRRLPELVDLLRNEGPVYLMWRDGRNTTLSTEYEPIGEGEGRGRR